MGATRDFWCFPFLELDLGNAGDHITQGGLSRSSGPAFLLERLFGREDSSSSFEDRATTLTPSGETVTTRYGMPDSGG